MLQRYPVGQNFVEITLSSTVLRDLSISVFCNFAKNSKIQNGRHFFLIGIATLQRNPAAQNFRRNYSI